MTAGALSLPELPNGFRCFVQPITIRWQPDKFDGAEKLHRVRIWPGQRTQFSALTRMATSSVEQFNSFATCPARSRAGKSLAAQVASTACVRSSVIAQFDFIRTPFIFKSSRCGALSVSARLPNMSMMH
jgi:hypothetical protein